MANMSKTPNLNETPNTSKTTNMSKPIKIGRRSCCIPGCTSNMPAIVSFPASRPKRNIWQKCIRKGLAHLDYIDWKTWELPPYENRNARMCANHFDKSEFMPTKPRLKPRKKIRLRPDALPVIFQESSDEDVQELEQREIESISLESMERAASLLAEDMKWSSLVPSEELIHCNAQFEAWQGNQRYPDAQPQHTPNAVLEHVRSALLRHRWNEVAKLLPYFFHLHDFKSYIWKTALQVVCYHPKSSEIEMMNLIRTCLQKSDVPDDYLRKIFCVQPFEDAIQIPNVNSKKSAKKSTKNSHK